MFAAHLVGVLAFVLAPASASAHGSRQPLDSWGGFESATARCQRAIGDAAATCAGGAWAERDACRRATLSGKVCDEAATTARIADLRRGALDYVDRFCTERQLTDLSYLGSFDVQSDVVDFCRAWPSAAESAAYDLPATSPQACIESTAAQTNRLMESVFRLRRQAMDAIAVRSLDLDAKMRILADAERRIARAVAAIGKRLNRLSWRSAPTVSGRSSTSRMRFSVPPASAATASRNREKPATTGTRPTEIAAAATARRRPGPEARSAARGRRRGRRR